MEKKGGDGHKKNEAEQVQIPAPKSSKDNIKPQNQHEGKAPQRSMIKRRNKKGVDQEVTAPDKRSSRLGKQKTTELAVPSDEQLKEMESSHNLEEDDVVIRKPQTKSPFKAIRGEGNSFHGWFS